MAESMWPLREGTCFCCAAGLWEVRVSMRDGERDMHSWVTWVHKDTRREVCGDGMLATPVAGSSKTVFSVYPLEDMG